MHVREIGTKIVIEHILLIADENRQVAYVGMEAQVVDVLDAATPPGHDAELPIRRNCVAPRMLRAAQANTARA